MFADSLLESPWADRSRRGWSTLLSFTAQLLGVGVLLAIPLLYTDGLPGFKVIASGAPLMAPAEVPHVATGHPSTGARPTITQGFIVARPNFHPIGLPSVDPAPAEPAPCIGCIPGNPSSTPGPGVLDSLGTAPPPMPISPKPVTRPPIVSRMMAGNLIYRVEPRYPALARSVRVQGVVVLRAIISRGGTIENLQVLNGHPLLTGAAVDAVRQWRYRPYILNGEPVEVETEVTVNFILAGG